MIIYLYNTDNPARCQVRQNARRAVIVSQQPVNHRSADLAPAKGDLQSLAQRLVIEGGTPRHYQEGGMPAKARRGGVSSLSAGSIIGSPLPTSM